MGTWNMPKNKQDRDLLKAKIKQLKIAQDMVMMIVGDDILCDHFNLALERVKLFTSSKTKYPDHRTKDCSHPAFYGDSPGTCMYCVVNL